MILTLSISRARKSTQGSLNGSRKTPQRLRNLKGMILIHDLERWTIFRSGFAMIVNARRCNVGMTKPLLHFGNVRLMIERVGRRSRAQGMRADFEPQFAGVAAHDSVYRIRRQ